MKKLVKLILFLGIISTPFYSKSMDCFYFYSKAGEAGTWTYGSCYGEAYECTVQTCVEDDGSILLSKHVW